MSLANRLVFATDYAGADLGTKINAADADLGADPGIIVVPPGDYTISAQVVLSADRTLLLGQGTITLAHSTHGAIIYNSRNRIVGSGNGTVIVENGAAGQSAKTFFIDSGAYNGGGAYTPDNDGPSDVYFADFCMRKGTATDFDSAVSAMALGNSHRVTVERVFCDRLSSIGIALGGGSNTGNHCTDVTVQNCIFYKVASQNLAAVNARRFSFINNNLFEAGQIGGPGASAYIDLEPNSSTDVMEDFIVANNYIDGRGGNDGNGIIIQAADATLLGPGVVANNVIQGGVFEDEPPTNDLSNGIQINGAVREVNVIGNTIRRTGQCGIAINSEVHRCNVQGNLLVQTGGGGIPALQIAGTYNVIRGNYLHFVTHAWSGSAGNWIDEVDDGDYNIVTENEVGNFPTVGCVRLIGANSQEFDNSFGGIKARCFPQDGAIVANTLVKRSGAVAGAAKQFTTADVAADMLGVCIGSALVDTIAVVVTERWSTRVPIKSDGTGTIAIGADIEPSVTSNGRVKSGSTNKIGANEGALVAASADALCTAALS